MPDTDSYTGTKIYNVVLLFKLYTSVINLFNLMHLICISSQNKHMKN